MRSFVRGRRTAAEPPMLTPAVRRSMRRHRLELRLINQGLSRQHDRIDELWRKADPYGPAPPERAWLKGLGVFSVYPIGTGIYYLYAGHLPWLFPPAWTTPLRVMVLYLCSWLIAKAVLCGRVRVETLPYHGRKGR